MWSAQLLIYIYCEIGGKNILIILQPLHMQDLKKPKPRQQQLKKRLQSIKSVNELKKIMKSSKDQNKKLTNQVRELRDRVEIIMNNQKINTQETTIHPQDQAETAIYQEIVKIKKQLKLKYAKMKQLKDQINAKSSGKIEQAENNKMNNINTIAQHDKNIKQLKKELQDLNAVTKKLQKTLEFNKKQDSVNQPRVEQLQDENKKLKTKIAGIRKQDYEKQHESIIVQTTLVDNRRKVKDLQARKSMVDLKTMSIANKKQMVSEEQIKNLKRQVSTLKVEVQLQQESELIQMGERRKKINDLYANNKEVLKKMKEVDMLKCKLEQQNNLWRKKWNNICRAIELHNKKIKKIPAQVQVTQFVDPKPLRRDYAGVLNKYRFDDRIILQNDKTTKITGMMIFEMQRGIVAIQAFYSNGERTEMPIPQHFIERCKVTKIECSENDFFKLFKIKYNSIDNKITKVEIRSNKNIKYQYGEKKQWSDLIEGDTVYGFDIKIKEYPVSIFGSYNFYRGYWLLEGFGVEINQLTQ